MHVRYIAVAALLFAVGCSNKAKQQASQAAAAKSAEEADIDQRSKVIAQGLIQQASDDAEKKRQAIQQQKADAYKQLHEDAMAHPGKFLTSDKLQTSDDGKRRLISISVTNTSKFSMTDIHGTVDYHGGSDSRGDNGDVLAQVPVQLTGAIAPGASMVFSEQQHTLSGTPIQLTKTPASVGFTVTTATVGSEGMIEPPPATTSADAGVVGSL